RGWEAFRVGYVAGLVQYLVALYWLLCIPYRWHGIPVGPAAGWLALGMFLALFPGMWVWMMAPGRGVRSERGEGRTEEIKDPPPHVGGYGVEARSWVARTIWALSGAAAWVGLEMIVARIFSGFPWDLLGVSQYKMI